MNLTYVCHPKWIRFLSNFKDFALISHFCWGIMGNHGKQAAKYSFCMGNPGTNHFISF